MSKFAAPRKSLGQNFLQDPNIINKIVSALAAGPADAVMEIGPGRGALTEQLLSVSTDLHLVEFDHDLVEYWQGRQQLVSNLTIHAADILKFDVQTVIDHADRPLKIIGNLPYNCLLYTSPSPRD